MNTVALSPLQHPAVSFSREQSSAQHYGCHSILAERGGLVGLEVLGMLRDRIGASESFSIRLD